MIGGAGIALHSMLQAMRVPEKNSEFVHELDIRASNTMPVTWLD